MNIQYMGNMKQKINLRSKAKTLEPVIRIGKNGLTEHVLNELIKLLKKRKLIKIKLPKTENKKELIKEIKEKTYSELIESIGNVIVLYRK